MMLVINGEKKKADFSGTVSDLIKELGLLREEVIIASQGSLLPDTALLEGSEEIRIERVIYS